MVCTRFASFEGSVPWSLSGKWKPAIPEVTLNKRLLKLKMRKVRCCNNKEDLQGQYHKVTEDDSNESLFSAAAQV